MTMIAIAIGDDRVEVMTDSVNYTSRASTLGRSGKTVAIPHLDTIVATQGSLVFGNQAKAAALMMADTSATFDDLADSLPDTLRGLWCDLLEELPDASPAWVFVAGYSPRAGLFVAYSYAAEEDFAPVQLGDLFVTPSPYSMRPSETELRRCHATLSSVQPADADAIAAAWQRQPTRSAPGSVQDWVDLAEHVRQQRAVNDDGCLRTVVAGDVFHTTVKRGRVLTKRIHAFNDAGEEFRKVVSCTLHPQGQLAECFCGSGARWLLCCGGEDLAAPCDCGSGQPFKDCHLVPGILDEQPEGIRCT